MLLKWTVNNGSFSSLHGGWWGLKGKHDRGCGEGLQTAAIAVTVHPDPWLGWVSFHSQWKKRIFMFGVTRDAIRSSGFHIPSYMLQAEGRWVPICKKKNKNPRTGKLAFQMILWLNDSHQKLSVSTIQNMKLNDKNSLWVEGLPNSSANLRWGSRKNVSFSYP